MPTFPVTPSALAYLYGDKFDDLYGGHTRIAGSAELPCRAVKVKDKDLAAIIITAAVANLAMQGELELTPGTVGRVFKSKALFARRIGAGPTWPAGSIEAQLLAQVSGAAKKDDVPGLVGRLWPKPHEYPWHDVFERVQRSLVGEGYYVLEERTGLKKLLGAKLVPVCGRIATLEAPALQLHAALAAWRNANRDVYQQLWSDAGKGIASRAEKPDTDIE